MGVYPIADRLAVRLVPGFRERMAHPRFLTMMAVGSVICSDFDEDEIASDGVSEPWQVYEWYVVQALNKKFHQKEEEIRGLPGRDKAQDAFKQRIPLNVTRYLKTATVFGFHGVYRTLANELNLLDTHGHLGEFGHELVQTWEKEQKMEGFYTTSRGQGRHFRNKFCQAVWDGLYRGEVARTWDWGFFNTIAEHLAPYRMGRKERETIFNALISEDAFLRRELIQFLTSEKAQQIWRHKTSERSFHNELLNTASGELRKLLIAIHHYERFSRLMQNAFESILYHLSENSRGHIKDIIDLEPVKKASAKINEAYEFAQKYLEPFGKSTEFVQSFGDVNHSGDPKVWIDLLYEYHKTIQKEKPPAGKKPWYEKISPGEYIIYSRYKRKYEPEYTEEYVNSYRTHSLWSFLQDLKIISNGS